MNNLKNVFIAGIIFITIETGLHSGKSSPHAHIEQINPITKWSAGMGQFQISGSTGDYHNASHL